MLLGVLLDADSDQRKIAPVKMYSAVDEDTEMDLGNIGAEGSCRAEGEPSWENLMDSDNKSMTSEESKEDLPQAMALSSTRFIRLSTNFFVPYKYLKQLLLLRISGLTRMTWQCPQARSTIHT